MLGYIQKIHNPGKSGMITANPKMCKMCPKKFYKEQFIEHTDLENGKALLRVRNLTVLNTYHCVGGYAWKTHITNQKHL